MKPHAVWKGHTEKNIVAPGDVLQNHAQVGRFNTLERFQIRDMALREDQRLKRPHRPKRNHYSERLIFADPALSGIFQVEIIAKEARLMFIAIVNLPGL